MATINSNGTGGGTWTATGTWAGGTLPSSAGTDTVHVVSGDTVIYNEDMSSWATGIVLYVDTGGILQGSTTPGTYHLKIGGLSYIHGSFLIGTSEAVPYPSNCKITIQATSTHSLVGNGTIAFYCSEPTTKIAKLTTQAATGTNRLYLDTDVSSEINHWKTNAYIGVQSNAVKNNTGANTKYITAVSGGATPYIDLDSNLTVTMPIGSWVYLRDRNIRITGSTSTAGFFRQASTYYTSLEIGAEFSGFTAGFPIGANSASTLKYSILGGVVADNDANYFANGFYYPATMSKCIFGKNGYSYGFGTALSAYFSDCVSIGGWTGGFQIYGNCVYNNCKFYGNAVVGHSGLGNVFNGCEFGTCGYCGSRGSLSKFNTCTFDNCSAVASETVGILTNCTVNANCSYGVSNIDRAEFYNTNILCTNEFTYNGNTNFEHSFSPSYDHDNTAGAFKSWTRGGITTFPVAITPNPSYDNNGGTGDRRTIVTISSNVSSTGTLSNLLDGLFQDNFYWAVQSVTSSLYIKFDFGTAKLITEAKYYQNATNSQGVWQWQGSNNDSTWDDIGATFTLGGVATQTITELSGNTTSYRYYRLLGVSGKTSAAPWVREFEFKINDVTSPPAQVSAYSLVLASETFRGFYQTPLTAEAGETITYNVYLKKYISMAYLPKVSLIDAYEDPLEYSTYTALVSGEMTDSIQTWEIIPIVYTNTTTLRQNLILRVEGKNASGTVLTLPVKVTLKESWG